jgi:hypothetical protein
MNKQQKIVDKQYTREQKACARLIEKMKYLVNHPKKPGRFYLSEVDTKLGGRIFIKSYYIGQKCMEFIKLHNATDSKIKFVMIRGDWVYCGKSRVDTQTGNITYSFF